MRTHGALVTIHTDGTQHNALTCAHSTRLRREDVRVLHHQQRKRDVGSSALRVCHVRDSISEHKAQRGLVCAHKCRERMHTYVS
jgi:hypothetical protein